MHSSERRRNDVTRWERNRSHWNETLDAQNLAQESAPIPLKKQLALYRTEDVRQMLIFLKPRHGQIILDLGGGLGLMAILLARKGADVVIADLSPERLKAARKMAAEAGLADRIHVVCCSAEALPFFAQSFQGQTTKSVLIHTKLDRAAAELVRTLHRDGRALFIEPLTRNPFVNTYRRLAAPKIWQQITDYFTPHSIRTVASAYESTGRRTSVSRLYFLTFFASPLNYNLHMPGIYGAAERTLLAVDRGLFRMVPSLRKRAWFCLIKILPKK